MGSLITEGLFERLLMSPLEDPDVDGLRIVSGYATPSMAAYHRAQIVGTNRRRRVAVDLTIGMTATEGLRMDYHRGFQKLLEESPLNTRHFEFSCGYAMADGPAVHSKVYVWSRGEEPVAAYAGSANYTQVGMGIVRRETRRELMTAVDPLAASAYISEIASGRIEALDPDVPSELIVYREPAPREHDLGVESDDDSALVLPPVPRFDAHVELSLMSSRTGAVHNPGGGLNHGQRDSRSNKNEAYIPVPRHVQVQGFFPARGEHFLVSTDDGKVLLMSTGSGDGGKDLRTPNDNGDLGEYLRFRMGIPNGAPFTDADFARYGRTSVSFYKIDDETYFLDFARP